MTLYEHVRHPWRDERIERGPVKVADQHKAGINGRVALRLCAIVGTMQAAYSFTALALIALPSVLGFDWFPSRSLVIVGWVSQTLIQLVMLAVLQLGQNLSGSAADARAESTYRDAELILHEASQLQAHLEAQDAHLLAQDDKLAGLIDQVAALVARYAPPTG